MEWVEIVLGRRRCGGGVWFAGIMHHGLAVGKSRGSELTWRGLQRVERLEKYVYELGDWEQ
jgi:hypothetical protein